MHATVKNISDKKLQKFSMAHIKMLSLVGAIVKYLQIK